MWAQLSQGVFGQYQWGTKSHGKIDDFTTSMKSKRSDQTASKCISEWRLHSFCITQFGESLFTPCFLLYNGVGEHRTLLLIPAPSVCFAVYDNWAPVPPILYSLSHFFRCGCWKAVPFQSARIASVGKYSGKYTWTLISHDIHGNIGHRASLAQQKLSRRRSVPRASHAPVRKI